MNKDKIEKLKKDFHEKVKMNTLLEYASIFQDEYSSIWNGKNGKYFGVDIYIGNHVIRFNFKVLKTNRKQFRIIDEIRHISHKVEKDLIYEKIGLKKDQELEGFLENSFYKINWNTEGFWSNQMALYDISKFNGAMIKSGINKKTK